MPAPVAITLAESAAVVTGGSGTAVDLEDLLHRAAAVLVDVSSLTVSAVGGSLALTFETRDTDSDAWRSVDSVSLLATGRTEMVIGAVGRYLRVTWALTAITTVTFAVTGIAHVVYCDAADLTTDAVPERSIANVSQSDRWRACVKASDGADGYLSTRYELPLSAWPSDMREHCANIAAASLFRRRGADPQSADAVIFDGRDRAVSWFNKIANGLVKPPGIIDSTVEINEGGSVVVSSSGRGW